MKKLIILLAFVVASTSVASAQGWGIGGRLGNGIQAVGQKYFGNGDYLEARLGVTDWKNVGADISLIYNFNSFNWNWTPGNWFLDFGLGANVNPSKYWLFVGVQGVAKFGYAFERTPLILSVDFSPAVGPSFGMEKGLKTQFGWGNYNNVGLSVIYRF